MGLELTHQHWGLWNIHFWIKLLKAKTYFSLLFLLHWVTKRGPFMLQLPLILALTAVVISHRLPVVVVISNIWEKSAYTVSSVHTWLRRCWIIDNRLVSDALSEYFSLNGGSTNVHLVCDALKAFLWGSLIHQISRLKITRGHLEKACRDRVWLKPPT